MPNGIHHQMFETGIRYLATEEQQKQILPAILKNEIIGCYAQTELGHGSNVQGLETTATLDKETDEIVLHSPKVSSAKFWPGDMGLTGTHAIIYAQLIVDGKKKGVQAFFVPIRDLSTHRTFPGIEAGDIGSKFGMNTKDNGYLLFTHYRIPRANMLMRFVKLERDGSVTMVGNPKILYSVMLFTRIQLCQTGALFLHKACLIGIRYSIGRT
mmetsp:Transcript_34554/g.25666  ORF Transcript_34554/g.25666 Transcript_34554/m.25666 type:complete len:212 (-) Transcript_34554:166-801(-)